MTNVLFVATQHNSIYAFNADKVGSSPLWKTNLGPSMPAGTALNGQCPAWSTGPELGILATPVIDASTNTIYAVYTTPVTSSTYTFYIAALDITTGSHKAGSPNPIVASAPGNGYDAVNGVVTLNQNSHMSRPALTLFNGSVYAGFGSCGGDSDPYHGWLIGYSAANVSVQTSVYLDTPNGERGAVWQGGRGMAVDKSGNMYVVTGNGSNSSTDTSDSVLKFSISGSAPAGVWTDPNATLLAQDDLDLGSNSATYMGNEGLLYTVGKLGVLQLLDPTKIGGSSNPLIQSFQATPACASYPEGCYEVFSTALWERGPNPLVYMWGAADVLRAYQYSGGIFNTTPDSQGTVTEADGGTLSITANGADSTTGIVWAVTDDGYFRAFQASNLANELYDTGQNATRDTIGTPTHFISPIVVNGKAYIPTQNNALQVYGLLGSGTQGTVTATATFVRADSTTQGNWKSSYGADGYNVVGDTSSNPTYAAPVMSGATEYTWAASTTSVSALQKASTPNDRIAAVWYSPTSYTIDSGITDQNTHQVALYCLDWTNSNTLEEIDVLDTSGNVVDTETVSNFNSGVYMVWNVKGHVSFRITLMSGPQAEVSGLFFGTGSSGGGSGATATFVKLDSTTQGNWANAYGAEGYNVIGDTARNPSYGTVTQTGAAEWTWAGSSTDVRALAKASNPNDRIAASWNAGGTFTIDSGITDQTQHEVALYVLDWDSTTRRENIDVLDGSGNVLNTQSLTGSFNGGVYLVWNVTGHVFFRITLTGGVNAVASGVFFGGPVVPGGGSSASAAFVKLDSTTQGNWGNAYGADGYNLIGDTAKNPSYGSVSQAGAAEWTWVSSSTDIRALVKASNTSDRIAASWNAASSFTIDSGITDQIQHQIALYLLDWDSTGRRETIDVLDTTGKVLSTQSLASSFNGGVYLVWNVIGHVVFRVTLTGGLNAVASGVFFGGPATTGGAVSTATATFVKLDSTTKGNWNTAYGADGYNVIGDSLKNPSYGALTQTGASAYIWASSTSDGRALSKASNPNDRIAATWYAATSYTIDSGINDTTQHQIALFCLDWDSTQRQERIDVLDAGGNVLNSQTLTASFNGGVYLVWNVTGHVVFRVTWVGGLNAVVSGVFFGGPSTTVGSSGGSGGSGASAAFVQLDSTTQGNWRNVYGAGGYNVIGDTAVNPTYAAPVASGNSAWTWVSSTTDVRALQKASNPSDRIAATWYSGSSFTIDTNITDQTTHQVAIYCLDWDSTQRQERIDVLDTSGNVLNSQTLSPSFNGGVYLVWNVTGHVVFRITPIAGLNAVISGLFFGQ